MIRPILLVALTATPAASQVRFQDTAALDVAIAAFTGRHIGEDGGARTVVDPRLKLAACPLPALDWRGTSQDAVVVTCDAPRWRIFVPVRQPPRPAPAAGAAAPIAKVAPVIRRGDAVVVEAGSPGFLITRDGVAMGDAPAGGRLMVRLDPARPPIQAVAIDSGRAALPGWSR